MSIKYSPDYQPISLDWKPPAWLPAIPVIIFNEKVNDVAKQQLNRKLEMIEPTLDDCKTVDQMNKFGLPKLLEKLRQNPLFENIFQYACLNGPPLHISIASDYPSHLPPAFTVDGKDSEGRPIRGIQIKHHKQPDIIMGVLVFEIVNAFHRPQFTAIRERLKSLETLDREEFAKCIEYIENKTLNLSIDILQYGEKHLCWKILPMDKVSFAASWERSNTIDSPLGSHADLYRRQWDQVRKKSDLGLYSKISQLFSSIKELALNFRGSSLSVPSTVAEANRLSHAVSKEVGKPNEIP